MKKRTLAVAALAILAFASCLKNDGASALRVPAF